MTHRQVVGTKPLSGAELVACALGHMPSELASAAALSHAGSRRCSCPGSEQTLLPQVSEHEQLSCAHFLHTCLEYGWGSEVPAWPMQDVEQVFLSICLAAALPAPSGSLRNTLLFSLMLIRRHRGKQGEEGRQLLWRGRAWSLESTSGASRLLSPPHTLETTISPTGLPCWQWPGQQCNGLSAGLYRRGTTFRVGAWGQ